MNISKNWLAAYIDLDGLDTGEMADMLTFAGVEVEAMHERGVTTDQVVSLRWYKSHPLRAATTSTCAWWMPERGVRDKSCAALKTTKWATKSPVHCREPYCPGAGKSRKVR